MSIESRSRQYGKVFDHWQIREFLGSGSGGKTAVFRMVRSDSNRGVSALKVVNLIEERGSLQELSDFRRREYEAARVECSRNAEQEVWLMDELRGNTNIVDYLDHTFVDWSDENCFGRDMLIRMELLTDLRSELRSGRIFTEAEVLKVGRDICTALALCHKKNILHRDVKPENIFRNKDGNYKLGDFGVSRVLDACPGAVASTGIGTYEYWPAEQMTGRYDTRVDTYSLGLVLYELSNRNRLPFAASAYATGREVSQRLSGAELPAPCDASPALARVILKACAFKPEDRFPNAEAFLRALRHVSVSQSAPQPASGNSYATAPAIPQTAPVSGNRAARQAVIDALAAENAVPQPAPDPAPAPARKRTVSLKLLLAAVAIMAGLFIIGWRLGVLVFGYGPNAYDPAVTAETTEAAETTSAATETETAPPETQPPETILPETESPETEPERMVFVTPEPSVPEETEPESTLAPDSIIGVVNTRDTGVNIRSDPDSDSQLLGQYDSGTVIDIYEMVNQYGVQWGRTDKGWVCMVYVNVIPEQKEGYTPILYTGWIIRTNHVNIRTSPSTSAEVVTTMDLGEFINIYETVVAEGMAWGRCDEGWVYLYYVDLMPTDPEMVDVRVVYEDAAPIYADEAMTRVLGNYKRMSVVVIHKYSGDLALTEQGWVHEKSFIN